MKNRCTDIERHIIIYVVPLNKILAISLFIERQIDWQHNLHTPIITDRISTSTEKSNTGFFFPVFLGGYVL